MTRFLKLIGANDWPLHETDRPYTKYPSLASEVLFPKGLKLLDVNSGDEMVYYAVGGTKRVFGIVRLTGDPVVDKYLGSPDPAHKRWPSAAPCTSTPLERVDDLSVAPALADWCPRLSGVDFRGKSHFELDDDEFEEARRLIRAAASRARTLAKMKGSMGST